MFLKKGNTRPFVLILISSLFLLISQLIWICRTYQLEQQRLIADIEEAFELAYQKEQTYRIPVVDIINPGAVTIESCGNEEIHIIRKCLIPDTIVYNNLSGHSIGQFMNRMFGDLREQIAPMNIYCMADLFAGILHDADIPVVFMIERIHTHTGELLETSVLPDKKQADVKRSITIDLTISNAEFLRGTIQLTPNIVLGRISGTLVGSICLLFISIICILLLYRSSSVKPGAADEKSTICSTPIQHKTFQIGKYSFNPGKNELLGFNESVQLNKKENTILYALCMQSGNVVERHMLLQENWGDNGEIYSRSLDTYLTALRKYLKKDPSIQIITIKGVGYKLVC